MTQIHGRPPISRHWPVTMICEHKAWCWILRFMMRSDKLWPPQIYSGVESRPYIRSLEELFLINTMDPFLLLNWMGDLWDNTLLYSI